MNRATVFALGLALAANSEITFAHDPLTHFDLSREAAQKSVLGQANTLADLGFSKAVDDETQKFPSTPGDQSNQFLPGCLHGKDLNILQLIACGSQFEDVPGTRSFNHFFDPTRGIPLTTIVGKPGTVLGLPNLKSPDWTLQDPSSEDAGSAQEFSYKNARDYFYDALTAPQQSGRDADWGKVFQSIGQIIHHPQDMAQPQHVRNDAHCDSPLCALANVITLGTLGIYNPSRYEKHTSIGLTFSGDPVRQVIQQLASTADGNSIYPGPNNANISVFNTPRKFFVGAGKGIAEYTNANFVSQGTNFTFNNGVAGTHPSYSQPVPGEANPVRANSTRLFPNGAPAGVQAACNFDLANCYLTFYSTSGTDPLTGLPFTNDRASTLSIFDQDLQAKVLQTDPSTGQQYSTERIFALNRFNFDAANQFLIPRAVSYSAGLINYFFRGKIDFVVDPTNASQLLVMNLGTEPMKGKFRLFYDDQSGSRREVPDAGGTPILWDTEVILASARSAGVLSAGGQMTVPAFPAPQAPAPKKPGEYMLVFAGEMGEEKPSGVTDSITGAQRNDGAVVGKLVSRPYNGALYLAGLDAQNRIVTFKIDPSGLRVLNGFDANGQFHSTPLSWESSAQKDIDPLLQVVSSFPIGSVLPKVARMKQATFESSGPGGMSHELVAISMALRTGGGLAVYAKDPATGRLEWRGTGGSFLRWTAHSPDSTLGDFEFIPEIQNNGLNGTVTFLRRFRPAPGQNLVTTAGTITLPPFSGNGDNYNVFRKATAAISPDGLTVSGFSGISGSTPPFFQDNYELKVTLGAVPAIALAQSEHVPLSLIVNSPNNVNQTTTVDPIAGPNSHSESHSRRIVDGEQTDNDPKVFVDYISNNLVAWRNQMFATIIDEDILDSVQDIVFTASSPTCPFTITTDDVQFRRVANKVIQTTTVQLDSAVTLVSKNIPSQTCGFGSCTPLNYTRNTRAHEVDLHQCGGDVVFGKPDVQDDMVFDPDVTVDTTRTGSSLFRTLNGKIDGSIVTGVGFNAPSDFSIRGQPLGTDPNGFVADASPLGEIFAAKTDKSVIVYNPLPSSGMPQTLAIPANIIKLIAAVWF